MGMLAFPMVQSHLTVAHIFDDILTSSPVEKLTVKAVIVCRLVHESIVWSRRRGNTDNPVPIKGTIR